MSWEIVLGVLPFLILLACPLHMWWMMRHMKHGESCGKKRGVESEGVAPADRAEEIRLLRERVARLESESRDATEVWK